MIVAAKHVVRLPIKCHSMPETRQPGQRPATTGHQPIQAGGGIDPHWHDRHQIVYAGRGVLSVTTNAGTWVTPATRALWIPAGTLHQHRAYGETTLHSIGLAENPLNLSTPTALVVSPLLRELILAYTSGEEANRTTGRGDGGPGLAGGGSVSDEPAERERLRGVLLDQLRGSDQRPTYLPSARDPRLVGVCELLREEPADPGRWWSWGEWWGRVSGR